MAGRPSKPIALVKGHRTKAEIEVRQKAEAELLTGLPLKEWRDVKDDPIAHKEFIRVRKALRAIGKDDALHENIINRYCMLHSECKSFEGIKDNILKDIEKAEELPTEDAFRTKLALYTQLQGIDGKLMNKRKMMLDIEKENIMTIASALRSIPKKPKEDTESPMAKFLAKRADNT